MSFDDTSMTGCRPRPQTSGGLCWHPVTVSATHASHSAKVSSNLLTANGLAIVTLCWGPSSLHRLASSAGEPIMNSPAGTTTISGHSGQSLKVSFGFRQRFSLPTSAATPSHLVDAAGGDFSIANLRLLPVEPAWRLAERAPELRWLVTDLWSYDAVGIVGGEPSTGEAVPRPTGRSWLYESGRTEDFYKGR
jgi:hypothetical protein